MKKYSKLLAMATAVMLLLSSVGIAADTSFDEVMANTRKEYSEYITKAVEFLEADGVEADADKASIFLMAEATDFEDDDIEHSNVFVYLPERDSEDFYAVSFYSETKKHSGTAKNFDISGRLKDLYSSEVKKIVDSIKEPEEIVNMRLGGRLSFLVYHIDAEDEDYVILYDMLPDTGANYNEMSMEEFEIEVGKIYTESEFLSIIHKEAEAYKEYLKEKEDKEITYKDKNDDVQVKKPEKGRDDDEDELCTCDECPDPECAKEPDDCDCDLEECTSEECREEALEKAKDKLREEKKDKHRDDDFEKKEKRNKKIKEVKDYGVFEGDEKGDLHEDEYITRAEFAVVVCKILGIGPEDAGKSDEYEFDDVEDRHWAKGYIKAARKTGIISGRGGNKYDPDAHISYEEAMKILVAAMGYSPMAEQKGGYPYGYTTVAENLGVPTDLTFEGKDEAFRGDIMEMVYNSLDVPMLLQKAFGDSVEYEVADGTNGEKMTIRIIIELKSNK